MQCGNKHNWRMEILTYGTFHTLSHIKGKVSEWSKEHGSGTEPTNCFVSFRVSQGAWVRIPPLSFHVSFCLFIIVCLIISSLSNDTVIHE
ncbi:hypothetical protein V8F44DRAFT_4225 [Aspergillus fumigatus]